MVKCERFIMAINYALEDPRAPKRKMAPTMTFKRISVLFLALFICTVFRAEAQTVTAASCNGSDVQTAFNAVTSSTKTVNIPAGTCNWTSQVNLTIPSGSTTLSVIGAGSMTAAGGGDQTVIVDNYASSNSLLNVTTNSTSSSYFRFAGITFEGGSGGVKYGGIISVGGSSANLRFDHDHISTATYSPAEASAGVRVSGCVYGVVDHSIFDAAPGSVNNAVQADNAGACYSDSLGLGDQAWHNATQLGSANFLYMENDTFNSGFANDCTWGGRFVMRFNTFNMTSGNEAIQTHPTGGAGRIRGCRAWEVYQNQFNASSGSYPNAAFWVSSGTGVVLGNTIPSSSAGGGTGFKNLMQLQSMRSSNATYPQNTPPAGWGYCGTAQTGSASSWDQNTNSNGYACLDQPGRGKGDLLQGGFTSDSSGSNNVCDVTSGQCASVNYSGGWPSESLEPIYEWTDNYTPVPNNPSAIYGGSASYFTQNLDYYLWCNVAAYNTGCALFTGAAGVGSGIRALRPLTCTTGVAYWSTDQGTWNTSGSGGEGVLDLCTATNTWTNAWYTPYTYPHPLDGTQVGPAPAVNVQAVFP